MKTTQSKKSRGKMKNEPEQDGSAVSADSILKPIGDLTIFEAGQFHEDLTALHQQEGPLELELSEIDRMDSSCVQLIVAATRSGRLTLKGYSSKIRDCFEQIGFSEFLAKRDGASES